MATTLTNFVSETQIVSAGQQLVFTGSTEKKFIGKATFTNTSTSVNVEVRVWRISVASTPTTTNWLVKKTVLPGKTWICNELMGHVLGGSMEISAGASIASVVNADLSGSTET